MTEQYAAKADIQKILVVDDNPTNVKLLTKILTLNGYRNVKSLTDSRLVMEILKSYQPDLLLLDLRMPFFDGFDILKQLKESYQQEFIPVIVITALNDQENKIKALKLGAQDFIGKPFDVNEVLTRIHAFLSIRMMQNKIKSDISHLEQRIREQTSALNTVQVELVDRLLKAVEFKDHETGHHITRIGIYAYILAKELGFSEDNALLLFHASKMHDIGKIGIADSILSKTTQLDNKEWEIMKTHTVKGAQILNGSSSQLLNLAEQIALTHHERWDGSGYPNGLAGEQIPLGGRITTLLDVFDALLSSRPYKEPWEKEKVLAYIQSGKGKQFDPKIVDAFCLCFNELIAIRETFE